MLALPDFPPKRRKVLVVNGELGVWRLATQKQAFRLYVAINRAVRLLMMPANIECAELRKKLQLAVG